MATNKTVFFMRSIWYIRITGMADKWRALCFCFSFFSIWVSRVYKKKLKLKIGEGLITFLHHTTTFRQLTLFALASSWRQFSKSICSSLIRSKHKNASFFFNFRFSRLKLATSDDYIVEAIHIETSITINARNWMKRQQSNE